MPQYLTACQITLNEQFPNCEEARVLAINCIKDGVFTTLSPQWEMPSVEDISLEAFFVIVNTHRTQSWTMPKQIGKNCLILSKLEIKDTKGLKSHFQNNQKIEDFDQESNEIMRKLF